MKPTRSILLLLAFILSACNLGAPPPQDSSALATSAALTVEAVLSPAPSPTSAETTPQETSTPPIAAFTPTASEGCENKTTITTWMRDGVTYDAKEVEKKLAPGKNFVMSWIVNNSGTCTWNDKYKFIFESGERLTTADTFAIMPFEQTVPPGDSLTITVTMTAPAAPGNYESAFSLVNAEGDAILTVGVLTNVGTSSSGSLPAPGDLRYAYDCTAGVVSITLTWIDKANGEEGYRIYRDGNKLTDIPSDSTTYSEIVPASGSYEYTVAAYDKSGESPTRVTAATTNCQ